MRAQHPGNVVATETTVDRVPQRRTIQTIGLKAKEGGRRWEGSEEGVKSICELWTFIISFFHVDWT